MSSEIPASASTLIDVLDRFASAGWTDNHVARPGALMKCGNCSQETPTSALEADALHRTEGASDPDDMQIVLGITCPDCGSRGAVVVGYGPSASETDAEFVVDLEFDGREDPVASEPLSNDGAERGRE